MSGENDPQKITISKDLFYGIVIVVLAALIVLSILTQGFGLIGGKAQPQPVQAMNTTQEANTAQPTTTNQPIAAQPTTTQPTTAQPTTTSSLFNGQMEISIPSGTPMDGTAKNNVTIVEFGDYQCSMCGAFFANTEPSLTQNYINTGKANFVFLDFLVIGADSQTLSEGAWCANDQGLYYPYHDYVYGRQVQLYNSGQGGENSGWGNLTNLEAMAGNISGLNVTEFDQCLTSGIYSSKASVTQALGTSYGIQGTPGLFMVLPKTAISASDMSIAIQSLQANQNIGQGLQYYNNTNDYVVFIPGAYPYQTFDTILSKVTS